MVRLMNVFYGEVAGADRPNRPKVTLGTFDGVHLGHQRVLRDLIAWARGTNTDAVAITFDRRPRALLSGQPGEEITSLPHRLLLFERLGLDATLVLTFDKTLAAQEPEAFVREILVAQLGATGVLLGHDARFGRCARGNLELLNRLGEEMGFETCSVPVVALEGTPVSSTRVRAAIQSGDLRAAERMLGRRISVLGTVVPGTGRGKKLGFPTANLDLHHETRPPEGVYATRTLVEGLWHNSVTNIGRAPTLRSKARAGEPVSPAEAAAELVVETHLLDFSGELRGKDIEVQFVARLRSEQTFHSPEALAARIAQDVEETRACLNNAKDADEPVI